MAFDFSIDTQPDRRRSLTGAELGLGGGMTVQPGDRVRPLNMQDILSVKEQMRPQEIQLADFDPVQVTSGQYDFIVNHLAGIKDKAEMEAEEIRIASALSYSRNLGLPFQYTLQNLDQIALEWNGIKYSPTATNFRSITDSFKLGTLRNERGTLGTMAMNASTPEELSQILAQSSQLSQQMQALQDSVPRPWYIDLLKMGAENIPYMAAPTMEGIEGYATARLGLEAAARMGGMAVTNGPLRQLGEIGLQATKIGGRLNLPLATALTAYSIYRNFQRGKEINQGNLFLDLLEAGVPADTARPIAGVAGSINQAIEMIGGVDASWLKAAGIDVDTVASRLLSRMVIRGRLAELGTFAARWGAEAFTEGTEEVFQGIVEGIASDYAYALSGIRNPDAENQESWIKEAADNFAGGFAVSLLLGLPAVAISTHADFQTVKDLRNLSLTVRSKESYDELAAAMRPEDINEADWKTVTDTQFERGKQEGFNAFRDTISQQDLDTTLVDLDPDAEVQSDDEVTGDGQQKVTVDRLSNGRLHGNERGPKWSLASFGTGREFAYGSPKTGKSYGLIGYRTDRDGHLTITNVRIRAGYENLRQEMVSDFISRFPDMDITWETNSVEEEAVRTNLINANPRGTDYGLNYGRGANDADIQTVRTRIGTLFSEDEATNSALAEIIEMIGQKEGMTGSQWLDRYIPEFRKWTPEEQQEADAGLPEGYHRKGASDIYELVDGVKAVVYAGEHANPTTFLHEMTHVLRRIGENGNEFRTLFNKIRNDADFQAFVNHSEIIKHKDLSTLFTTDKWTRDDDEFFAELGEAYWMSGQTVHKEISGFFARLTRLFRQLYRALRGTGRLNDEVVAYYDRLYGAGTAETVSSAASSATETADVSAEPSSVTEGTDIADDSATAASDIRKGAYEESADSSDPVITAGQSPDPSASYTPNASYAVSEWNAAMFRDAFRQQASNETVRNILDSIPVAFHRMAGLVRITAGNSLTPNDQYILSPRYENMTEEDAAKMQQNAEEYAAAVQVHSERERAIIADGTVALDYTVNGKSYHMDNAAVDGLGMFTPVEYIEEAGLQDNPVRLSINADNVRIEGLDLPDPNMLWNGIPDRTPVLDESEFDEYDPYDTGLDEDGNPLYQTFDEKIEGLREKYSPMIEDVEIWTKKPVRDFFGTYKPQITEMIKEYPKVEMDGVLLLEGMDASDMPLQKELIQARILQEILGENIILLPRYATNTIERVFGIRLQKGSLSDGLTALVDGDRYIEFKVTNEKNFVKEINSAIYSNADIAFEIVDNFAPRTIERLNSSIIRRLSHLNPESDIRILILDTSNGVLHRINKEANNSLPDCTTERISGLRTDDVISPTASKVYGSIEEKVNKNKEPNIELLSVRQEHDSRLRMLSSALVPYIQGTDSVKSKPIDYSSYQQAPSTDRLFQTAEDYNPEKIGHGYKLFEQDTRTGRLYPLFIGSREETPVGTWLIAQNLPTKGYANRPGWHIGSSLPDAPWLKGYSPDNSRGVFNSKRGKRFRRVWAEVSYPMDVNYQEELDRRGIKDIKDHTPEDGYYTFREANGTWIIAGALRVDRILSEEERQQIFNEAGYNEQSAWENSKDYAHRKRQYEKRIAKQNSQLFQTSQEWQETETRLRANESNFDIAGRPLAPNGQLSDLPYREWVTVRTPSFLAWFGDWMNDPGNASKVVDENGEPKVVYHGTDSTDSYGYPFTEFEWGNSYHDKGAWFSDRMEVAWSYGGEYGQNHLEWSEDDDAFINTGEGDIYAVFLNIRNPLVVDAEGRNWNDVYGDDREYFYAEDFEGNLIESFDNRDDLDFWRSTTELIEGEDYTVSSDVDNSDSFTTRDVVANLDGSVADGVIFRDIVDIGKRGHGYIESTVFTVTDSASQIKSIDNLGTFDSTNPDIMYQTAEYTEDLVNAVREAGGEVSEDGLIHVYHRTTPANAESIRTSGRMLAKENGLFFSTKPDGQASGYGEGIVDFWIPANLLEMDDWFGDEVHLRYPLRSTRAITDIRPFRQRNLLFQTQAEKKRIDDDYFAALERGDMETAQRIVDNQARLNGYITDDDYRMMHRAPNRDEEGFNKNIRELADGADLVPSDYWSHPEWYGIDYEEGGRESFNSVLRSMQRVRDKIAKGDSENSISSTLIRMYRAVPADVKEDSFRNGDWITPSRRYAEYHGQSNITGRYRIIRQSIPVENAYWNGDSINEWGYDDGKAYAYRNTKNNRKLIEPVVRDYDGNIVPPSKRFDYRKAETFYQTIGYTGAAQLDNWAKENGMDAYHLLNLDAAIRMENDGASAETIRKVTGWERGIDDKWRTEIPDYLANFRWDRIESGNRYRLGRIYESPDLYTAYPDLENISVVIKPDLASAGAFSPSENAIYLRQKPSTEASIYHDADYSQSTNYAQVLMHEIQHVIQGLEGFASGGSTSISPAIRDYAKNMEALARKDQAEMRAAVDERAKPYSDIARAAEAIQIMRRIQQDPRAVFRTWVWGEYGTWGVPRNRSQQLIEARRAIDAASSEIQEIIAAGASYQDNPEYAAIFKGHDLTSGMMTDADLRNLLSRANRRKWKILDEIANQSYAESLSRRINYFSSIASLDDFSMYQQLAGEVEARATANKLDAPDTLRRLTREYIDVRGKTPVVIQRIGRDGDGYTHYDVSAPSRLFFQTLSDEEQDAYIEAAQNLAIENHEALFQTMDFRDSEEMRGYFSRMVREAANYTDYDEFHAMAEWIYPDDEMVEKAWSVAKNPDEGSDNTGPIPGKTLANPDLSASSDEAKDKEFIEIISADAGFNEWLNAIRNACRDVDSENTRAVYEAVDKEVVAPLIRNLVFPKRKWVGVKNGGYEFAALNEKSHAKAIASAKGILKANPSFYRDLYAKATESDFWMSAYGDGIPQDIIDERPEEFASLSASGRQKLAERIRNERLRRAILAGSEKFDPSQVKSLIKEQDDAIEQGKLEVQNLENELKRLGRKYGDSRSERFKLWYQVTEKDREISDAQQRLADISNRIAANSRRDFGDDGIISQRLVDQQQRLASQISELVKQQDSYLRQLKNEAVSDAVRAQYDRDLARMRAIRQDRDEKLKALRERYREREALRAVNRHKEELAEIIMREPSKGVDLEEADKIRAIQALLDPAFRRGMRVNGEIWDIKKLKAMFRGEVERDPVVFGALSEEQLTRLSKKDLNEWTLEELEEMAIAVRALREQGLRRRQLKTSAERARIQRYRDAAMSAIIGSGNYKEPPVSGSTEQREEERSLLNRARNIYRSTINMSRKSQILDGTSNRDENRGRLYNATLGRTSTGHKGIFHNLLVDMKRDAEAEEFRMMTQRMKPIRDRISALKINEERFYENFDIDFDGRKTGFRYSDLVYIYLSQNSLRNRDAVAYGIFVSQYEKDTIKRAVEDEIIGAGRKADAARTKEINNRIRQIGDARYESILRQAESIVKDESRNDLFEIVRLIEADFNSGLFERLRRAMGEIYNIRVEKEEYYLPINRTDFAGSEPGEVLKQDLMNLIPGYANVNVGMTKDRVDHSPYWQKPINIDFFNVWQQSVYNQEHALSHLEYVRLLKGVFLNKGSSDTLRAVISSTYGRSMVEAIETHINQIANPQSFTKKKSGWESAVRFFRGALYSSYLGYKGSSIVLQMITSPLPFLGAVNPLELAQSSFTVFRNPIQMWEEIQRLSPFMANRSPHPIIEWMNTEARRGDLSKARRRIMRFEDIGMTPLELVDRYAVSIGWWAIYQKERTRLLNEGNLQTEAEIEKAAARVADDYVQETQPQSNITELSPMFQNRNEALSLLTQFQSSLNVIWQNVTYDIPNAIKNGEYRRAIGMSTGYIMAGALLYMVQQGFDDDDDDKEKMRKLLYGMTTQITSGVPLVSDLVDNTLEVVITGETSNFFSSSYFPAADKLMKAVQNTAKQDYGKALENFTDSMLLFTGFPYSGFNEAMRLIGVGDEDGKLGFYPGEIVGRRHE